MSKRIPVVEDDDSTRFLSEEELQDSEYTVFPADNGMNAQTC